MYKTCFIRALFIFICLDSLSSWMRIFLLIWAIFRNINLAILFFLSFAIIAFIKILFKILSFLIKRNEWELFLFDLLLFILVWLNIFIYWIRILVLIYTISIQINLSILSFLSVAVIAFIKILFWILSFLNNPNTWINVILLWSLIPYFNLIR